MRRAEVAAWPWLMPVVSLLAFSLIQWQNWFLGWQLQEFLNVLAAVCGFVLLAHPSVSWTRFAAALACGLVATFSFANGLAFWFVGFAIIFAVPPPCTHRHLARMILWALVTITVTAAYLNGFHEPEGHPSLLLPLSCPLQYARYVLLYLGTPIAGYHSLAAGAAGACGLVSLALLTRRLARASDGRLAVSGAFLAMAAYAIAAAALTGVGRIAYGAGQPMSSRYATMANLLWLAVAFLAFLTFGRTDGVGKTRSSFSPGRAAAVIAWCVFMGVLGINNRYGTLKWTERYVHKLPACQELVHGDDPELLYRLYPDHAATVVERREVLRKWRLSVFR
jgi:hypothetical protein